MFLIDLWQFLNVLLIISLSCCFSVGSTDVKFSRHLVFHLPGAAFKNNIHAGCVPGNHLLGVEHINISHQDGLHHVHQTFSFNLQTNNKLVTKIPH